ncbi:MAG: hypothetical protein ABJ205_04500 [Erythrobacter sp.]|uniref:hypothetical protein n=1 Tax=Erythrobacter sp. TaxID=1042 RepID=UPI00326641A3
MNEMKLEELARLRDIAEKGRNAPLLGGSYMLIWGAVISLALLIHWVILMGYIELPEYFLAINWLVLIGAGWALSLWTGVKQQSNSGTYSFGNQTANNVWASAGAFLTILAVSLFAYAAAADDQGAWTMLSIMAPVSFGSYSIALNATHVAAPGNGLRAFAYISLGFCVVTALLIGSSLQYLVAAGGMLLSVILPGLKLQRSVQHSD